MFELKFKPIEAESNIQHFSTYKDLCLFIENGLKEGYVFAIRNRIPAEPEVLQVLLEEDEDEFNILLGTNFTNCDEFNLIERHNEETYIDQMCNFYKLYCISNKDLINFTKSL